LHRLGITLRFILGGITFLLAPAQVALMLLIGTSGSTYIPQEWRLWFADVNGEELGAMGYCDS
jgi:hypothetical protein